MANPTRTLHLGSRGSALARWQAEEVQRRLLALGTASTIEWIKTSGDQPQSGRLAQFGGKGLFTKEIEEALLAQRVDIAVHSLKDVPSDRPHGLVLGAVLEREDARDALVAAPGATIATLPARARVGTCSLRRQAQLLALRPDLQCLPLRGNVDSRLKRWRAGEFDGILLASAGLRRLGLEAAIAEHLDFARFCPAGGQGALAIECRAGDTDVLAALAPLNDPATRIAVAAERALLRCLQCDCNTPVGAHATWQGPTLRLQAVVATPDGSRILRCANEQSVSTQDQAEDLGQAAAENLLSRGAREILLACEAVG